MKLCAIYRVMVFEQEPWLKLYNALNTAKRQAAVNPFVKDFYKLMHNNVFGKCLENMRQQQDVKIVTCLVQAK